MGRGLERSTFCNNGVLQNIAKKENCQLPLELAERIAEKSNRNLRRAILLTEACRVAQYPFTDGE